MIGIVILTYNTWDETVQCIESILKIKDCKYQVYVVDNASTQKISTECTKLIDGKLVKYIYVEVNGGYAKGNNVGIRYALQDGCDAILIANNDIVFTDNIFTPMYSYLSENPNVGIVGPKVILENGMSQQTQLGCKMTVRGKYLNILRKTPFRIFSKNFVNEFYIDIDSLKKERKVYGVSGCCFMVTAKCLEKIGLFDENTFLYEEENIIGCKMDNAGLETMLLPYCIVIHKHSQSTKHAKPFSFACIVESEMYYCRKYLHAARVSLLGLYLIRTIQYLVFSVKYSEYRKNIAGYFRKTFSMFSKSAANLGD